MLFTFILLFSKANQENPQAESSFYEDQLDNELESLSLQNMNSSKLDSPMDIQLRNEKRNSYNKSEENLVSPTRRVAFEDSVRPGGKRTTKSANGNHHVSFNINNAIYSTRQEIPISIIKGSHIGSNTNSNNFNTTNGYAVTKPIQSSLKKSTTTSTLQCDHNKMVDTGSNEPHGRFFHMNKPGQQRTTDTKTTIL